MLSLSFLFFFWLLLVVSSKTLDPSFVQCTKKNLPLYKYERGLKGGVTGQNEADFYMHLITCVSQEQG
jgi:hypothetical protein